MSIKIGNTSYSDIYLGSTGIQKAYLGDTLVYNKHTFPISGLTSYWRFDETSGTTAYDSFGGNDGTASNSRVFGTSGKRNNCADFTKGEDWINTNRIPFITLNGMYSISCWIKVEDSGTGTICNNYISNSDRMGLGVSGSANGFIIRTSHYSSGDDNTHFSGIVSELLQYNTWHHVVRTYNNKAGSLYVNGVLQTASGSYFAPSATTFFVIGRINDSYYFNGYIDEFAIWNRALSAEEVSTLYNGGLGMFNLNYEFFDGFNSLGDWDTTNLLSASIVDGKLVTEGIADTWSQFDTYAAKLTLDKEITGDFIIEVDLEYVGRTNDLCRLYALFYNSTGGRLFYFGHHDSGSSITGSNLFSINSRNYTSGSTLYMSSEGSEPLSGNSIFKMQRVNNQITCYVDGALVFTTNVDVITSIKEIRLSNVKLTTYNGKTAKWGYIKIYKPIKYN